MWGLNTETIPVVIGALGLIKKGLENYIQQIPGNTRIEDLQKISLSGTAHIFHQEDLHHPFPAAPKTNNDSNHNHNNNP